MRDDGSAWAHHEDLLQQEYELAWLVPDFYDAEQGTQMNINELYPSDYLKAADLKGKSVLLKMEAVEMKELGSDKKPVLYFKGKDKGLVLNKTNGMIIASVYGPETSNWSGKEVKIYPGKTSFNGQMVDCIKVEVIPAAAEGPGSDVGF